MENKSKALEYLNIARSTFYYQSILDEKDEALRIKIESVMADNQSYGHKRIAIELGLGKKQVRRGMKKFGLEPSRKRKKPWKRAKGEESLPSPNLLVTLVALYKHHLWVTDFTYLKWRGRWVYVCTVIDLWSREVVAHINQNQSQRPACVRGPAQCPDQQSVTCDYSLRPRQ